MHVADPALDEDRALGAVKMALDLDERAALSEMIGEGEKPRTDDGQLPPVVLRPLRGGGELADAPALALDDFGRRAAEFLHGESRPPRLFQLLGDGERLLAEHDHGEVGSAAGPGYRLDVRAGAAVEDVRGGGRRRVGEAPQLRLAALRCEGLERTLDRRPMPELPREIGRPRLLVAATAELPLELLAAAGDPLDVHLAEDPLDIGGGHLEGTAGKPFGERRFRRVLLEICGGRLGPLEKPGETLRVLVGGRARESLDGRVRHLDHARLPEVRLQGVLDRGVREDLDLEHAADGHGPPFRRRRAAGPAAR